MPLDRAALNGDARRVSRVLGDELLARVRKKAEDLRANDDPEALHDFRVAVRRLRTWLRAFEEQLADTLRGNDQRRLDRIADATRDSRDLEVHLAWIEQFSHAHRKRARPGSDWLIARFRARKARADLELRRVLDDDYERTENGVRKAFSSYTVTLDGPPELFSRVIASLVRNQASAARAKLASVATIGDRIQGHQARIAAKRLRYLLEPLRAIVDGTEDVVAKLTTLQDDFGALHDAQIFGNEIARMLAKASSTKERRAARAADKGDARTAADDRDAGRVELLSAIARRLRRDEEAAFKRVTDRWLGDKPSELWTAVESIAATLDETASHAQAAERRYLLRTVGETPPGTTAEVEVGYLQNAAVVERLQRVTASGRSHYYRSIALAGDGSHATADEEIKKSVFTALWPLTRNRRVKTRRRSVDFEGHCWVIDRVVGQRDVSIASVALADSREAIAIPEWLEPMIDRDVTEEAKFTWETLASSSS